MDYFYFIIFFVKSLLFFSPVCHGCSTGKEFITTFLPNFQQTHRKEHKLNVVLTSQGSEANVHIQVRIVFVNKYCGQCYCPQNRRNYLKLSLIHLFKYITVKVNLEALCYGLEFGKKKKKTEILPHNYDLLSLNI